MSNSQKLTETASLILIRKEPLELLWMQRALRSRFLSGFHAFPGGRVDPEDQGDSPDLRARAAVLRETEEEIGLKIPPESLLEFIGRGAAPNYLVQLFETHYYLLHYEGDEPLKLNPMEVEYAEWIRPQRAMDLWRAGRVLLAPPTLWILSQLERGAYKPPQRFPEFPWGEGGQPQFVQIRAPGGGGARRRRPRGFTPTSHFSPSRARL